MNEGICSTDGMNFNCSCSPDYIGPTCERVLNQCATDPCQNGGYCQNMGNSSFSCSCPPDTTGSLCDIMIDDCAIPSLIDCSNNGVCVDGNQTFSCACNPGYTGSQCQEEIDECVDSGCSNGICTDLLNDYNCSCYTGWEGRNCDSRINYCVGDPIYGPCNPAGTTECEMEIPLSFVNV